MNAVATHPLLILENFVTKTKNSAGIYTVKFYIRGKPWLITVDDDMAFRNDTLYFGKLDQKHPAYWGVLLEKAWSKLDFNAENSAGGFAF